MKIHPRTWRFRASLCVSRHPPGTRGTQVEPNTSWNVPPLLRSELVGATASNCKLSVFHLEDESWATCWKTSQKMKFIPLNFHDGLMTWSVFGQNGQKMDVIWNGILTNWSEEHVVEITDAQSYSRSRTIKVPTWLLISWYSCFPCHQQVSHTYLDWHGFKKEKEINVKIVLPMGRRYVYIHLPTLRACRVAYLLSFCVR